MLTYPEIDPIIFSIGPLAIRWYGLMYVVGFLLGWWLARRRAIKPWSIIKPAQVDDLVFYTMLGVIVGGRVGYGLFYGTEQLFDGGNDPQNREDMFLGNPAQGLDPFDTSHDTFQYTAELIRLRREHTALRRGGVSITWTTDRPRGERDESDHNGGCNLGRPSRHPSPDTRRGRRPWCRR